MDSLQAIILGAIQGFTEFIPISSSAHLVVLRWFAGWDSQDLVFDVALHLGTLFALLAYFWREWYGMIRSYFATTRFAKSPEQIAATVTPTSGFLLWPIVLACVPAGIAGIMLEDVAQVSFRSHPELIAASLIGFGLLMFAADRIGRKDRPMHGVRGKDWLIIGLAQALAIIPGVSRSGITITAGLLCGLEREAAARFSFLLGAPIILGAGVFELRHLSHGITRAEVTPLVLGISASTVVGYLCIKFLMGYVKRRSYDIFVAYRIVLGVSLLATHGLGWLKV